MSSNIRRTMRHTDDQASFPMVLFSSFFELSVEVGQEGAERLYRATLVANFVYATGLAASADAPDPVILAA
jgi:hypothetical protein